MIKNTSNKKAINTVSSRNGDPRHITNNGGGCYTVEGKSLYTRGSAAPGNSNDIQMFDFEGGPCFCIGEKFLCDPSNAEAVIETIIPEKSNKKDWAKVSIIVR